MKKQILILAFSAISLVACAQTKPADTAKVAVPQISEETLARMAAAKEEQRVADSIAIAKYTKKFIDSIPAEDLILITSPNMKVEYVDPKKQKKSASKKKPTHNKTN